MVVVRDGGVSEDERAGEKAEREGLKYAGVVGL